MYGQLRKLSFHHSFLIPTDTCLEECWDILRSGPIPFFDNCLRAGQTPREALFQTMNVHKEPYRMTYRK